MDLFLSQVLSYVLLYKYFALFALVFLGSFIFFIVPGNALLLAVGAFASQGYMQLGIAIVLALVANIGADVIGFWLTHRYGDFILKFFHIRRDGKLLRIEHYLSEYAFGTVFLTRLAGPFAPSVNFLSGIIGVPFKTFLLADVLGNSVDIFFFTLVGYALGNYWESFLDDMWVIGAIAFVLFIVYLSYKHATAKKRY